MISYNNDTNIPPTEEADGGAGSEEEADKKGKRGRKRKAPGMNIYVPAKTSKQPRYELSKGQWSQQSVGGATSLGQR